MSGDTIRMTGGCQCGAVRYAAEIAPQTAHLCHCRMCQKAVGNLFAALASTKKSDIVWTRGQPSVFRSSEHIDRGFCAACGTPLYYDNRDAGHLSVTIGSLDHPERIKPQSHNGVEGRMPWFSELQAVRDLGVTDEDDPVEAAAIRTSNRQHPDHDTDTWPRGENQP